MSNCSGNSSAKRRFAFAAELALALWLGGCLFYAGVVIPIGSSVLESHTELGFITREVTRRINWFGAPATLAAAWGSAVLAPRSRRIRGVWTIMAVSQAALFALHPALDSLLDPQSHIVLDPNRFYFLHRVYLLISTIQWTASAMHLHWVSTAAISSR